MHRSVLLGVIVLAVLATGAGVAVSLADTDTASQGESVPGVDATLQQSAEDSSLAAARVEEPDFDRTYFQITVESDGSAQWTFRYERLLTSSDEREQFEQYAEQFEDQETEFYQQFTEQASALVAMGEDTTEREMSAEDFERRATVEREFNERGVVEMSFTWTNFAPVEDDRVIVSDVFDGWFFLMEDQSLEITAGDGLVFEDARPDKPDAAYSAQDVRDADTITWRGEQEFIEGHPYVVLVSEDDVSSGGEDSATGWLDPTILVGGVALVVLAGLGAVAYARLERDDLQRGEEDTPPDAPGSAASETEPIADDELLSDEDRVQALIRQNGGRMKQVNIVDETGWSKSKVSMLLSDMEEEGQISKLRVGRENIISLDGFEPEATKSPFDE